MWLNNLFIGCTERNYLSRWTIGFRIQIGNSLDKMETATAKLMLQRDSADREKDKEVSRKLAEGDDNVTGACFLPSIAHIKECCFTCNEWKCRRSSPTPSIFLPDPLICPVITNEKKEKDMYEVVPIHSQKQEGRLARELFLFAGPRPASWKT